ncbi:hypothetical protein ACFX1T_006509 [Malus domestica]
MKSQNWNSDDTGSSFDLREDLKVMPSVNINAPEDLVAAMKGKVVIVEIDSDGGTLSGTSWKKVPRAGFPAAISSNQQPPPRFSNFSTIKFQSFLCSPGKDFLGCFLVCFYLEIPLWVFFYATELNLFPNWIKCWACKNTYCGLIVLHIGFKRKVALRSYRLVIKGWSFSPIRSSASDERSPSLHPLKTFRGIYGYRNFHKFEIVTTIANVGVVVYQCQRSVLFQSFRVRQRKFLHKR